MIGGSIKNFILVILLFTLMPFLPVVMHTLKQLYHRHFDPRTQVGVIPIKGTVYDEIGYIKQLHTFFKDDEIKAILLKIECPGTAAGSAQAIFKEIRTLKQKYPQKFIASWVVNVCASGGYYIAAGTDAIIVSDAALIGSIGARFGSLFQVKELLEQYHVKCVPLKAGEYKAAGDPFASMTPAEQAMLQSVLDDTYQQFAHDVAEQRHLSVNALKEWAEGKIFTGRQASKLGLVDYLGSLSLVESIIKERTLTDTDINWVYPPKTGGLFSMLQKDDEQNQLKMALDSCISYILQAFETRTQSPTYIM